MSADVLIEALTCTIKTRGDGAVVYRNVAGDYHRTGGPAIIHPDGEEHWYQNGKRHRTDGPAIVYPTGEQHWYQNGKRHRTDGPAVVHPNGLRVWSLNGVPMLEDEHSRRIASGEYLEP